MPRRFLLIALSALSAGCDPDEVEVQPLPSLESLSEEARAGVPEVAGSWRFAGWELAPGDTATAPAGLPRFGTLELLSQRRDSVGGQYVIQAGRFPLTGEVRRDRVVSLVSSLGPGDLRYLTGRLDRDTIWMELSSLTEPGSWPDDARAAFVRSAVAATFTRVRGQPAPTVVLDSAALAARDSAGDAPAPVPAAPATPVRATPPAAAPSRPAPSGATPARPGTTTTPTPSPRTTPPARTTPPPDRTPAPARPTPRPAEPEGIPLLGDPVPRDTTPGG